MEIVGKDTAQHHRRQGLSARLTRSIKRLPMTHTDTDTAEQLRDDLATANEHAEACERAMKLCEAQNERLREVAQAARRWRDMAATQELLDALEAYERERGAENEQVKGKITEEAASALSYLTYEYANDPSAMKAVATLRRACVERACSGGGRQQGRANMSEELKPCPGCGSDALKIIAWAQCSAQPYRRVCCQACGFSGPYHVTDDEAASAWNTRAADTELAG